MRSAPEGWGNILVDVTPGLDAKDPAYDRLLATFKTT